MTVTETLGGLGSWELQLVEGTPDAILTQLGLFGHIAIVPGPVDVEAAGDGLLAGARYVGVTRSKGKGKDRRLAGSGMLFWLGDEDNKGHVLEAEVSLTAKTLEQSVPLLLPPTVTLGTVHPGATGTYTGKHVFQSPRQALTAVVEAFGRELRVNGNATVDVGTQAQLYTATPDSILVRKGAGSDLDLTALAGELDVDTNGYDYSTDVVLLGQTVGVGDEPAEVFATARASAPVVPYLDLRGNPVKLTRLISESGQTAGSVASRVQLQLNRFNRVARSLAISLDDYEVEGNFRVGDMTYVFDPETDIFDPAREVDFRGELLHPDVVRVSGMTWPVARGMTVAFRTQAGVWLDLTPFVTYETGSTEVTIGDLPRTLSRPGDDPIQVRVDAARGDPSIPGPPTGLGLTTSSGLGNGGQTVSTITASWTAPATNTDGSVVTDLSHYLVAYRPTFRAAGNIWTASRIATTTQIDLSNLTPDLDYDVRVAAVDLANHVSAWTAVATIRSAKDAVAPPAPADPVVTQVLGQARIQYTGVSAAGQPMPADTNRVDVHVGTTAGFTATAATLVRSLHPFAKGSHYETVPYGAAARWTRLVAVDNDGNVSGSSASVPLTASQVVNPDIFDGAVGSSKLQDLAVITAKIADLAVNNAKIGSMEIGKLTAGTMNTDMLVAGQIATAFTGQRSGLNALGFFAYNASNVQTIRLNGIDNLLTGKYRTADTGRRMELGTVDAGISRVLFIAPDGRQTEIGAFTGQNVGEEAIRIGVVTPGVSQLWNKIQLDSAGGVYSWSPFHKIVIGGDGPEALKAFRVSWATSRATEANPIIPDVARLLIDDDDFVVYDTDGSLRILAGPVTTRIYNPAGRAVFQTDTNNYTRVMGSSSFGVTLMDDDGSTVTDRFFFNADEFFFRWRGLVNRAVVLAPPGGRNTDTSPAISLIHATNHGSMWYHRSTSSGTSHRIEFRDAGDTIYEELWAAAFTVSSSQAGKTDVTDFTAGALDGLRSWPVKKFRRKPAGKLMAPERDAVALATDVPPLPRQELGFIAELMPPELQVQGGDGPMLDVMATVAYVAAAVQELAARVDSMETR